MDAIVIKQKVDGVAKNTAVYPMSEIQKCIVHQIRNSLAFVSWNERKELATDLKPIYTAINEESGISALEKFALKWDKKYPHISKSWYRNWDELSTFFKYGAEIRKLIYTTNPIESLNRGLKKVCKNKCAFPTENSVLKQLYLATENIQKKWTQKIRDWGAIYSQLSMYFDDRVSEKYVN